jgi:hypothetical protein
MRTETSTSPTGENTMSTAKKNQPYWIKERHNPQTGIYYVAMGQMSTTAAKRNEKPLYGTNYMLRFDTEQEYQAELERLRTNGERVHT